MQLVELEISNTVVFRVTRAIIYIRIFLITLIEFIFIRIIRNVRFFLNITRSFVYSFLSNHYYHYYHYKIILWMTKGKISKLRLLFECRSWTTKRINKFNTSLNILLSITHILSGSISLSDQAYPKHSSTKGF